LHAAGTYHRPDLQVAVASGIVFQMDQTAPADQSILRDQRERSEDANLDRRVRLFTRRQQPIDSIRLLAGQQCLLPLPRTRICDSQIWTSSRLRAKTSHDRKPCSNIRPTMARSRDGRKLDQKRATASTDNGTTTRLGVLT